MDDTNIEIQLLAYHIIDIPVKNRMATIRLLHIYQLRTGYICSCGIEQQGLSSPSVINSLLVESEAVVAVRTADQGLYVFSNAVSIQSNQ